MLIAQALLKPMPAFLQSNLEYVLASSLRIAVKVDVRGR